MTYRRPNSMDFCEAEAQNSMAGREATMHGFKKRKRKRNQS
jgi:hypothetical protein